MVTINGLHILLTYQCTYECDHCFVWGSPFQTGTFTLEQLDDVLRQAAACHGIEEIFFEGGEPCLYFPLLVAAVQNAHQLGFKTGIVSNAYWAHSETDAELWLRPLKTAGLDSIDVSSDLFHGEQMETPQADFARRAAAQLDLDSGTIQIEPPSTYRNPEAFTPGDPVTGGDVMYRGRAAVKLTASLPRQAWDTFTTCPYENLTSPGRLHLDPFGNLHLCQGLVIGNLFQTLLSEILDSYQPDQIPVVAELLAGGPAAFVQTYGLQPEAGYVDACHLCYAARLELRSRFPQVLAPDQIYGVF